MTDEKNKLNKPLDGTLIGIIKSIVDSQQKISTKIDDHNKELEVLRMNDEKRRSEMKEQQENIDKQQKKIEQQQSKIKGQQSKIDNQDSEILKQKEDLREQKSDLIQYFGLFVAIFTAISIDIQLLRFAQNVWQIAGLVLMINTAPLFFFFLIRWFYKNAFSWDDLFRFFISFLTIFIAGMYLVNKGGDVKPQIVIERIESNKTEIIESSKDNEIIETKEILNNNSIK
ncbi:MAG: hypothetical protein ACD_7C00302G0003 [uncultured bacterium]|nr:MAG: hypothetical protein ACD_7C00302G0003 [uncultured bacterium]HBR79609.1 hypothetical protein [Candidatus Moranbacteria bacterium]